MRQPQEKLVFGEKRALYRLSPHRAFVFFSSRKTTCRRLISHDMSDERRAKFKGKDCLARSADLKRGAQDARHKKSRERALDTKRVMLFESQEQPDRNRSMHALNLLKEVTRFG